MTLKLLLAIIALALLAHFGFVVVSKISFDENGFDIEFADDCPLNP